MRREEVEVFSDESKAVVIRHLSRHFPGCLIQGDSLSIMLQSLLVVQSEADVLSEEAAGELRDVVESLSELMSNYRAVLLSHGIPSPF
ncbi:DUF6959 family protein [Massilia sp. BKSP1R2A-1]|uniref:DUF6959 family protein n=1 Tax=Massilia sp. BKSP1R2A-1 TaxID=3422595 RepID=UPI003D343127